jgi:hypothetical protein
MDSYNNNKFKINLIWINKIRNYKEKINLKQNLRNQIRNQNNNNRYQIYPSKYEQLINYNSKKESKIKTLYFKNLNKILKSKNLKMKFFKTI